MIKKIKKIINRYGLNLTKSVTIDEPEVKEVEKVIEYNKGQKVDEYK